MIHRDLVSRLALVVLILAVVAAVGCSSGKSKSDDEDPTPTPVNITGTVFQDLNGNGVKDANEVGIAGVVVSNGLTSTVTGPTGSYTLTKEGSFIFVTTPRDYAPSTAWYQSVSGSQFNFGLKAAPERNTDNFTFIHMTDIHLDAANLTNFQKAVEEFKGISPAFVVSTGDLVNTGDTKTISEAQANEWFGAYKTAISALSMPVYNALGNHDAANLSCESAAGAQAGCSKNAYRSRFGPTYYSFDWGQFHCIVLDPNEVEAGSESFKVSASQLGWLQKDLGYRQKGSPLLVFCHEPTTSWKERDQVLSLLKQYKTTIFSGHAHADLLMNGQDFTEQVTSALSGEWGHGDNPDGSKPGYRIVSVSGDKLDSFYKEIGSKQQIEISPAGSAWPIVSGQVALAAKIYTENGAVSEVTYSVDNSTAVTMTTVPGQKWVTATATWDTGSVSQDYHRITVTATDGVGSFPGVADVKVSTETTLTIKDLQDHLRVYQGHYVTIKGTVEMALFNTGFAPMGAGGALIADKNGRALIYAGECYLPPLPSVEKDSTIQVKVIPMRFTWAFVTATEDYEGTFDQFATQESMGMIPDGQKEDSGSTKVARWFMRLVSAGDITKL